ncbi:MAG: aminotransferase class I/II-fold pyridoxal phosphate-dependent enzyme [Sphingomonadaceae bacterium]|nr:aminotransferase class I/II-fold pyridoxal phosphate-dependent enzyme [Sphingomonadaceae bacterium]
MTIATLRKDTFLSTDFDRLNPVPADALLGLIGLYRADPRADKIDLGVGVFRDDAGATPVMQSVKDAEASLLKSQTTKSYLGAEGDAGYAALLADIVMGPDIASSPNLTGVQTPGGTGALRLGAELLARAFPDSTVWIGEPTWPNHGPIFMEAGLKTKGHSFYEVEKASIDFDAMMSELEAAHPGDILLLHGCCHNPTGVDFTSEQWARVTQLCIRKSLIPFIDLAYQGLGDGLEEDAKATRGILASLPTVLLAYSCDKNFGLYRERVGALWVQSPSAEMSELVRGNMLAIARSL